MKKIHLFSWLIVSVLLLCACSRSQTFESSGIAEEFIKERSSAKPGGAPDAYNREVGPFWMSAEKQITLSGDVASQSAFVGRLRKEAEELIVKKGAEISGQERQGNDGGSTGFSFAYRWKDNYGFIKVYRFQDSSRMLILAYEHKA